METRKGKIVFRENRFLGIIGEGAWVLPTDLQSYFAGPVTLELDKGEEIEWYEKFLKSGRKILLPKTTSGVKLIWKLFKRTNSGLTLKY